MLLNLLPIAFLLMTVLILIIVSRTQAQVGTLWLVFTVGALLSFGTITAIRWLQPAMITIEGWVMVGTNPIDLVFGFDNITWVFAFALATLLLGVAFTLAIRLDLVQRPQEWTIELLFVAMGLLPIMAQNLMSLVVAWTILDFFELLIHVSGYTPERINRQAVMAFAVRMGGSWLLIAAQATSETGFQQVMNFSNYDTGSALLLLLAAGLRLGIFPVFMPFQQEAALRREFGAILRFVVSASSLVLLTRLSALVIPGGWAIALSAFALIGSLGGSVLFLLSSSELTGRNYWIAALAGMAVVSVVRGRADAALAWSIVLLLTGGFLSLHSEKQNQYVLLVIIALLGISGLPFSASAAGFQGLVVLPFSLLDVLYLIAQGILLLAFLKQGLRIEDTNEKAEGWMKAVYPLGLLLLVGGQWVALIDSFSIAVPSFWWLAIFPLAVSLAGYGLMVRFGLQNPLQVREDSTLAQALAGESVLYPFIEKLYFFAKSAVGYMTAVLQGDAGLLWMMLLFLMILTIIIRGVS
ncbi:MAG TPA: hypothetical protein ENN32_08655 [Chloroflexi bacterium]|nr:hypothetical protein [Chloroflexota bacterium]